jgi:hypothetical protein
MPTTVTPATFTLVAFDAGQIGAVADELLELLDLTEHELRIEVDETTPLARITAAVDHGVIVVGAESGAFEDTRRPRHLSVLAVRTSLGRMLTRVGDRLRAGFDTAPADPELTPAHVAAWDAYAVGRLGRAGVDVHRPKWLYNFRNRHGFTDAADSAFDRLWAAEALSWQELAAISDDLLQPAA